MGTATSIILGAAIGLLSKNQQAATAFATPVAMILGFTPIIANFNEIIEKISGVLYTQQLNAIVNDFSANFPKAISVIGLNIIILSIFFLTSVQEKRVENIR